MPNPFQIDSDIHMTSQKPKHPISSKTSIKLTISNHHNFRIKQTVVGARSVTCGLCTAVWLKTWRTSSVIRRGPSGRPQPKTAWSQLLRAKATWAPALVVSAEMLQFEASLIDWSSENLMADSLAVPQGLDHWWTSGNEGALPKHDLVSHLQNLINIVDSTQCGPEASPFRGQSIRLEQPLCYFAARARKSVGRQLHADPHPKTINRSLEPCNHSVEESTSPNTVH